VPHCDWQQDGENGREKEKDKIVEKETNEFHKKMDFSKR